MMGEMEKGGTKMSAVIIVFVVAVVMIAVVAAIAAIAIIKISRRQSEDNKDKRPPKERCTIRVTGVLVYVHEKRDHFSPSEHEVYYYYPVFRYEYNGQDYETEYNHSSNLWNLVEKNSPVEVFVNPEDANDIYVPVPEAAVEKDRRNRKIVIICFLIYFAIAGAIQLAQYLLK
jgi:hypothetical protein